VSGDFADARFGRLTIPFSVGGVSALVHAGLLLLCQGRYSPLQKDRVHYFCVFVNPIAFCDSTRDVMMI
jgi:hypothetical protein